MSNMGKKKPKNSEPAPAPEKPPPSEEQLKSKQIPCRTCNLGLYAGGGGRDRDYEDGRNSRSSDDWRYREFGNERQSCVGPEHPGKRVACQICNARSRASRDMGRGSRNRSCGDRELMSHELQCNCEENLHSPAAVQRQQSVRREPSMKREQSVKRESSMKREQSVKRESSMKREQSIPREPSMKRELSIKKEQSLRRDSSCFNHTWAEESHRDRSGNSGYTCECGLPCPCTERDILNPSPKKESARFSNCDGVCDQEEVQEMRLLRKWEVYKRKFDKWYPPKEDIKRKKIFAETLKSLDEVNKDFMEQGLGIGVVFNELADLTEEEKIELSRHQ